MAKAQKRKAASSEQVVNQLKKQLKDNNSLWESKYKVLKGQLKAIAEESYIHGYRDAIMDQAKLDEAFDKHMEMAASEFEKLHLKKLKAKNHSHTKPKAKLKKTKARSKTKKR